MLKICAVSCYEELVAIKQLQTANLRRFLTESECQIEGFVTAEYTVEFLKEMHDIHPSIIAKDGDEVVGYNLVVGKAMNGRHELLNDLFDCINRLEYNGQSLADAEYVLCGQLCVAKGYRGKGLASKMYQCFKDTVLAKNPLIKYCLTDIARDNPFSLKAHQRVGFEIICSLEYSGVEFEVVLWDWLK